MIINTTHIEKLDTIYPSVATLFDKEELGDVGYFYSHPVSTTYGYVIEGQLVLPSGKMLTTGDYFSMWNLESSKYEYDGKIVVFTRIGIKGQNTIGYPIEEQGRLSYIDGCTDTLLIYPPRLGDPSLNALFFPPDIEQSQHTHPSIRLGYVVRGFGSAILTHKKEEFGIPLEPGMLFCIDANEKHKFKTADHSMVILAYHPDGDWGPTDHNHTMLNRTYLTK
jgi:quercetin dioxygenase-like cupin family protein